MAVTRLAIVVLLLTLGCADGAEQGGPTEPEVPARTWQSVTTGPLHTCAVASDGVGYCWGLADTYGKLGVSDLIVVSPSPITGGIRWKSLAAGENFTCGIAADGKAYCWGSIAQSVPSRPLPVSDEPGFTTLTAGGSHVCGITRSHDLYCWGNNQARQLGNGQPGGISALPARIALPPA